MSSSEWEKFQPIRDKVNQWAKVNAQSDYMYGAPYTYYRTALSNNVISKEEYDFAKLILGPLWDYRGD